MAILATPPAGALSSMPLVTVSAFLFLRRDLWSEALRLCPTSGLAMAVVVVRLPADVAGSVGPFLLEGSPQVGLMNFPEGRQRPGPWSVLPGFPDWSPSLPATIPSVGRSGLRSVLPVPWWEPIIGRIPVPA